MTEDSTSKSSPITSAETTRTGADYLSARDAVRGILTRPLDNFSQWVPREQQEFMQAARIFVSSTISLARAANTAPEVARFLGEAKEAITTYYNNPQVDQAARARVSTVDEFDTEMGRDKVLYLRTYAALINQEEEMRPEIIRLLGDLFEKAKKPTAKTLVGFEKAQLEHQKAPTEDSFANLTRAYAAATNAAEDADRKATITARYIIAAEAMHGQEEAVENAKTAYQGIKHTPETKNILERERRKAAKEKEKHAHWQATKPQGETYEDLSL